MKCSKRFVTTVLAVGIAVCGSAYAIQYYNLTHIENEQVGGQFVLNHSLSEATINGALFTTNTASYPTGLNNIVGTGVLSPFVRIHKNDANCGNTEPCVEYGYNTSGDGTAGEKVQTGFNAKDNPGHPWNHTLTLANIGMECDKDGKNCMRIFVLDINESKAQGNKNLYDEFLSLDQFRIFQSNLATLDEYSCGASNDISKCTSVDAQAGNTTSYNPLNHGFTDGGTVKRIFDMDLNPNSDCQDNQYPAGAQPNPSPDGKVCDRTVGLNYALHSGSGNGVDLVVKVPDYMFDKTLDYVYLFSSFGELGKNADKIGNDPNNRPAKDLPAGDFGQSAGFEEWSTMKGTPVAPTLLLFAIGAVAMGAMRKMRRSSPSLGFGPCLPA